MVTWRSYKGWFRPHLGIGLKPSPLKDIGLLIPHRIFRPSYSPYRWYLAQIANRKKNFYSIYPLSFLSKQIMIEAKNFVKLKFSFFSFPRNFDFYHFSNSVTFKTSNKICKSTPVENIVLKFLSPSLFYVLLAMK